MSFKGRAENQLVVLQSIDCRKGLARVGTMRVCIVDRLRVPGGVNFKSSPDWNTSIGDSDHECRSNKRCSGFPIFLVIDGFLYTVPLIGDLLPGALEFGDFLFISSKDVPVSSLLFLHRDVKAVPVVFGLK